MRKIIKTKKYEIQIEEMEDDRVWIDVYTHENSKHPIKSVEIKEKQEEKKEYMIEFNEKIKIKARNRQDARYEFEERMFEATGGCYQKALDNLIDLFKVTEKH